MFNSAGEKEEKKTLKPSFPKILEFQREIFYKQFLAKYLFQWNGKQGRVEPAAEAVRNLCPRRQRVEYRR